MNVIIDGFMRRFRSEYGFESLSDDQLFETFAAFCVIRKYYSGNLKPDECRISGADHGVDAGAVIVNGNLFTDPQILKDYIAEQDTIDPRFVLVRAQSDELAAKNTFALLARNLRTLFGSQPTLIATTAELDRFRQCIEVVYSERIKFRADSPNVSAVFVMPGKLNLSKLSTTPAAAAKELKAMGLFASIEVEAVDAEMLRTLFHRAHAPIEASMQMTSFISLPNGRRNWSSSPRHCVCGRTCRKRAYGHAWAHQAVAVLRQRSRVPPKGQPCQYGDGEYPP
jgi:hypothetical protein